MRKIIFIALFFPYMISLSAQSVEKKLKTSFAQFEADPQLKYAISSLLVIDAASGKVVFDKNSLIGLAPASTQKIVTAATAFELLGNDFRYSTVLGHTGVKHEDSLTAPLFIKGSGDPTFGSWRFSSAKPENIFQSFSYSLRRLGLKQISDHFFILADNYEKQTIPNGWIWQDIGNYYGAGVSAVNWQENQYDLILKSGNQIGTPVGIVSDNSATATAHQFHNRLAAAAKGTGDNAYIYLPSNSEAFELEGTIPVDENNFKISGAITNGADYFINSFRAYLKKEKLLHYAEGKKIATTTRPTDVQTVIATHYSPSLDSIVYWFLQKSINLYGEALLKTIGEKKFGLASTETGIVAVKDLWKQHGIDEKELNISDGSGLSPQNRVTTHAQVEILKYAKTQSWFSYFYAALPEYNAMKMKSGTIKDVKGFCGYHKAKDGKEYIFSFLVNNYNGTSSGLVTKMYKVLDVLK